MHQIYDQIINLVKSNIFNINDAHIQFSDQKYKPFNFDIDNFHEIKNSESSSKIAFIDAGSAEIIKSSNFSLILIRVYNAICQNNKRINSKKQDFYAFVSAKNIDNE